MLFEGLVETRQIDAIAFAWEEAWDRGEAWRQAITKSLARLPPKGLKALGQAIGPSVVDNLIQKTTDR